MKYEEVRYCGICGDLLTGDARRKICSDKYCQATIMVYHDLLGGEQVVKRKYKWWYDSKEYLEKNKKNKSTLRQIFLDNPPEYTLPVIEHVEKEVVVTEDPRGIHNEEKNLIFSKSSAISCLYKIKSTSTDKVGLTIQREKGESVKDAVVRMTHSDEKYLSAFDVIYGWMCGCSLRTAVTYETLQDLPTRSGYYGECQRCRSHALCIEVKP